LPLQTTARAALPCDRNGIEAVAGVRRYAAAPSNLPSPASLCGTPASPRGARSCWSLSSRMPPTLVRPPARWVTSPDGPVPGGNVRDARRDDFDASLQIAAPTPLTTPMHPQPWRRLSASPWVVGLAGIFQGMITIPRSRRCAAEAADSRW